VSKEHLFEQVFPGAEDVQYEAIEVVAYRLRKKLAHSGVMLVTLRGPGLPAEGRDVSEPMGAVPTGAARPAPTSARALSLRRYLLLGILLPVGLFVVINTWSLYRQAQVAATTAYDRTLLASAKSISEQLDVEGYDDDAPAEGAGCPYSALEAFEADNQSRIYYKVSNLAGELVSGYTALPRWQGRIPRQAGLRRAGGLLRRHLPR
jgi:hypothetical protein